MLRGGHNGTKTLIDHSLPPGIPPMCHADESATATPLCRGTNAASAPARCQKFPPSMNDDDSRRGMLRGEIIFAIPVTPAVHTGARVRSFFTDSITRPAA